MTTWKPSGFESIGHYEESMRDFTRVLDYLDRAENISEERKELYHRSLDEIGMDGVFELARNTNELFKELGINSYKLQQIEFPNLKLSLPNRQNFQSLEEIVDIANFREESIGKGRNLPGIGKTRPSWDYVTSEMNEKHGKDWSKKQIREAYYSNKFLVSKTLLSEEEE